MAEYSAGTYTYTSCVSCSGGTPQIVALPHPVYSRNNLQDTVVQLTAVALGGFNGVNN